MIKGLDYIGVAVVFFCHDGKGEFLMAKRSKQCRDEHGMWDIGGGGIEFGDEIEDTLKKEIQEEYCTPVLNFEFLGSRNVIDREYKGKQSHWITFDFKVLVERKKVKIGEPHKFEEIKWFKMETVPSKDQIHSQLPYFLKKYKDKL